MSKKEIKSGMTKAELIEQLCQDLNAAHNTILKLQGVDDVDKWDWPEWSSPANSIRAAETLLNKRLAKTDQWSRFPLGEGY